MLYFSGADSFTFGAPGGLGVSSAMCVQYKPPTWPFRGGSVSQSSCRTFRLIPLRSDWLSQPPFDFREAALIHNRRLSWTPDLLRLQRRWSGGEEEESVPPAEYLMIQSWSSIYMFLHYTAALWAQDSSSSCCWLTVCDRHETNMSSVITSCVIHKVSEVNHDPQGAFHWQTANHRASHCCWS